MAKTIPARELVEAVAASIFNAVWQRTGRAWPRFDEPDAPPKAKEEARHAARAAIASYEEYKRNE